MGKAAQRGLLAGNQVDDWGRRVQHLQVCKIGQALLLCICVNAWLATDTSSAATPVS